MKPLNVILLILLLAAIVAGAVFGLNGSRALKAAQSELGESERELAKVREELRDANFKYRGVLESRHNIPDSLRNTTTGQWLTHSRNYAKRIRGLEAEEKEANRQKRKRERAVAEARKALVQRLILTGGAAVVLAGALVARRTIGS